MPLEEIRYRVSAVGFAFILGWALAVAFLLNMGAEARAAALIFFGGMVILAHLMIFINKAEKPIKTSQTATHVLAGLTLLLCLMVATVHWYIAVRGLTFTDWFDYRLGLILLMWTMGFMEARRTWRQIQ